MRRQGQGQGHGKEWQWGGCEDLRIREKQEHIVEEWEGKDEGWTLQKDAMTGSVPGQYKSL